MKFCRDTEPPKATGGSVPECDILGKALQGVWKLPPL